MYNTRMAAHCKHSYKFENKRFLHQELDVSNSNQDEGCMEPNIWLVSRIILVAVNHLKQTNNLSDLDLRT
jgi:hypothetical protein